MLRGRGDQLPFLVRPDSEPEDSDNKVCGKRKGRPLFRGSKRVKRRDDRVCKPSENNWENRWPRELRADYRGRSIRALGLAEWSKVQNAMLTALAADGAAVTRYRRRTLEQGFGLVHLDRAGHCEITGGRALQRGLFASTTIKKGEVIAPFVGRILTEDQFLDMHPAKGVGRIVSVIDDDLLDFDEENRVQIEDNARTRKQDIAGLTGRLIEEDSDGKCTVELEGWVEDHYTLSVPGNGGYESFYIDAHVVGPDERCYLVGLAVFCNSGDETYTDDGYNNAVFAVDYRRKKAYLVAKETIDAGEEIFASYTDFCESNLRN